MASHDYYIDVVGGCNLQCPSCPVGSMVGAPRPKGVMSEELFRDIARKIRRENPDIKRVSLYNWTEPSLHPRLPRLIEIAREEGLQCSLSTNLNNFRNMDGVIAANPRRIRISLSGFTQPYYERTHRKGDVEVVKANMRELRETIDRLGADTRVHVIYHCYVDNCGDELSNMRALADELDFEFQALWAHVMTVEKNLSYFKDGIDPDDQSVVDLLAVKPEEYREIALRHPSRDCHMRSHETTINCDGSVALCCSVYDSDKYSIATSFLEHSKDELQRKKYSHPLCGECMRNGYHDVAMYTALDEWTAIARDRIAPDPVPDFAKQRRQKSLRRRVRRFVRRALGAVQGGK